MGNSGELSEIGNALLAGSTWNIFGMQAGGPLGYTYPLNDTLLGMVTVFQENRFRKHVKSLFAGKTYRLFPRQTKGKHIILLLSICTQKWKYV